MLVPAKSLLHVSILIFLLIILGAPFFNSQPKEPPLEDEPELYGNFLHITDLHPDPLYVSNVTVKSRCHEHYQRVSKKPKHMFQGVSGTWGAPTTICDTPLALIDTTFEWLEKNWKNKIDFIIWTGDNSRHDSDENIPRTPVEIFRLNRMITERFLKTFANTNKAKKKNAPHFIPIVPSIGNNDVYPNSIIDAGPNHLLSILHDIWHPFIPNGQHKTFMNGGYYYTEVIPGKLIVVSLNTLYFYNSNTAVNGCAKEGQPGTAEMKWLNDVLERARELGMKVYLTGHVAPRAKQYTVSCYKKYGRLSLKYQDIILGHYYGHSNMDHFFFIGNKGVKKKNPINGTDDGVLLMEEDLYNDDDDDEEEEEEETVEKHENEKVEVKGDPIDEYTTKLLNHYRSVPPTKPVAKDYVVVHINPSIVPTFFPALRIFKYNTTKVINNQVDSTKRNSLHENTFLTPLGYTQYFMNLTHANLFPNIKPEFTVEYTTWDDYNMKDLTVPSWIQLTREITNGGNGIQSSLWKKIQDHLVVGTKSLIKRKNEMVQQCIYSKCPVKGPMDYLASEISF